MATRASKLGPGRLTFGTAGSPTEFGSQVTKCTLEPSDGDTVAVLDGGEVTDGDFKLTGEFYQDYASGMNSLIVWCKENAGKPMPFEFIPTTSEALGVKGQVTIAAVKFGGDIKKRNTTEFSFAGVGDYDYYAQAGIDGPDGE